MRNTILMVCFMSNYLANVTQEIETYVNPINTDFSC